jgi:hypothetical protein
MDRLENHGVFLNQVSLHESLGWLWFPVKIDSFVIIDDMPLFEHGCYRETLTPFFVQTSVETGLTRTLRFALALRVARWLNASRSARRRGDSNSQGQIKFLDLAQKDFSCVLKPILFAA